jgi:PAS domain S-box-containing protein
MIGLHNISIRRKLTCVIMITSLAALLLAGVAFVLYDVITLRSAMLSQITTLSQIIGNNSTAALVFNDQKAADETLGALNSNPNIVAGSIFNDKGEVFAKYVRTDVADKISFPSAQAEGHEFGDEYLTLFRQIEFDNKIIGTVYLQYDLEPLRTRMKQYAGIVFIIMLVASVVALIISSFLQRLISSPILELAETANTISQNQRYDLRAVKHGNDEIGVLIDGFNEMLSQIQIRDAALELHSESLEAQIAARTAELSKANADLRAEVEMRNKTEKALAAETERLSVTLRSIADGVIATDLECRIILINRAAELLTGHNQEQAVGADLNDILTLMNPRTQLPVRMPVDEIVRSGRTIGSIDTAFFPKQNSRRVIAHNGAPIHNRSGQIIGVILAFRDITETQKMEEEILKSRRLESIGILAGGIAHDFNNLLTAILGNVTLAKSLAKGETKLYMRLEDAEKASLRARDLTQQLLTFSKGGAPIRKTASIVEILIDSASFVLSGSNVECDFSLAEDLWPVNIDESQISQVINNIIINADHSMASGGVISVQAKNVIVTLNDHLPLQDGKYVKISIMDRGVGIPEEHIQKIFDPYFTTKQKGSGLGLATCYSIIKKHDGIITVESKVGAGSVFCIYLPASQENIHDESEKADEGIIRGGGRILVMDDQESVRDVADKMLRHLGYSVDLSADGSEALEKYRRALESGSPYDAVIMDLTVPGGMGGEEATCELLKIDSGAKAIVSSGYAHGPIMANYRQYGFVDVIVKPYKIDELGKVVYRVVHEKN